MTPGAALVAVTHDGTFHADDVFAAAALRMAFPHVRIVRSRDASRIAAADIVFDVGGIHSDATRRYDHHMIDGPARPDGSLYSSFGLVWRAHGLDAIAKVDGRLRPAEGGRLGPHDLEAAWKAIDAGLVRSVDRIDNGQDRNPAASDVSSLIAAMAPKGEESAEAIDRAFEDAVGIASTFLGATCVKALSERLDRRVVLEGRVHGRILALPRPAAWDRAIRDEGIDVDFVVLPDGTTGNWVCRAVPASLGSMETKVSFPDSWRALRGEDFSRASGVPGGVFCHHAGFICGNATREGAIELGRLAIEASLVQEPRP